MRAFPCDLLYSNHEGNKNFEPLNYDNFRSTHRSCQLSLFLVPTWPRTRDILPIEQKIVTVRQPSGRPKFSIPRIEGPLFFSETRRKTEKKGRKNKCKFFKQCC